MDLWRRQPIAVGHKKGLDAEAQAQVTSATTQQAVATTRQAEMELMDPDRCRRAAKHLDPELMKPVPDAFDLGYRSVAPAHKIKLAKGTTAIIVVADKTIPHLDQVTMQVHVKAAFCVRWHETHLQTLLVCINQTCPQKSLADDA